MASSGMVWKGGVTLTQKIESTQRKAIKTIIGKILITMDGVAVDTAKYMREFIESVPSSIRPGKIGRVDTGSMQGDVKSKEYYPTGKNSWAVEAGWVDDLEHYYLTQEHGGMAHDLLVGDRKISPMHMLTAGRIYMELELHKGVKAIR